VVALDQKKSDPYPPKAVIVRLTTHLACSAFVLHTRTSLILIVALLLKRMADSACHFIVITPSRQASMNRSYNLIFNCKLGIWQVASERTRSKGKSKSGVACKAVLLTIALGASMVTGAWADENLLVGSGGSSSGLYMLGGGGGIGGGGGAWYGGGGGGIAGGGGAVNSLAGDGGGATVAAVIGDPSGTGGIGGGGGFGSGGGGGAIGGSGGNTFVFVGSTLTTVAGGIAGQTTGALGGNGSGTTPGLGGAYGGNGGGIDSGGGGGGTVVDGNGAVISGQTPGAGVSGAASLSISNNRSYAYVGVGGGGAGGGSAGTTGTAGSAGSLTVDSGAAFTVSRSMLIGGGGGGAGLSGTTGGGDGTVAIDNARLAVSETLLVGGSGGGGNSNGSAAQAGGQGGGGTLTLDHSTLSSVTFLVGGNGGNASTFGGSAGRAGNGTVTLTNTTATISGGVAVGGIGGSAGIINGTSQGSGGAGGNGTLTLDQTTMSVGGDMVIGNRGGAANLVSNGDPHGDGPSGVGGTGVVTVTQSNLAIAHNLYIGGNGGDGLYVYNSVGHTAGAGSTGSLSVDGGTLSLSVDIFVGGNGGTSYYYNHPNSRANNGGNGGNGILAIGNNAIVNVQGGNLVLGGQQGAVMQAGATVAAAGTGTLNLGSGSLNFSGGASFTIKAGNALNVGNATVNGVAGGAITGLGSVNNNGVINFNQADSRYVFNPGTTGTGSVLQNSAGTTALAGAMTHTGGTIITAGKLQIGNGGSSGSVSGDITDNATLSFNRQDAATYAGIISGTGNLFNEGSGTIILTGANVYTGGTTVTAGTLQFGDGGATGSVLGDVTNNGTLAFNRSDSFTYANVISGTGNLIKSGTGDLSIVGSNVYTGNTTVRAGTLQFDSYTQSTSSVFGVAASSNTDYGKLVVTGVANLPTDAKINVDVGSVNTLALRQVLSDIISAGTLNASSFAVTDNSALFNFRAAINGNAVDLTVIPGISVYDAVTNSGASAASGAAGVLDNVINNGATGDMNVVVTALGSLDTQDAVKRAVTQTLPGLNSGVTEASKGVLNSINRLLQNRQSGGGSGLSGGDDFSNRAAWLKPFGSRADQDDKDGVSGFNAKTWGMAGGIEGDLSQSTRLGVAYAYANSKVDGNATLSGTQQHVDIEAHVLALYGTTELSNGMALGFQGDIGQNSNDGTRHINFGGLNRTATSDYKTYTAHAGISLAKALAINERTSFTPTIRADYTLLRDDSYSEQGAGALSLDVAKHSSDAFVLGADARISHTLSERNRIEGYAGIGYDTINKPGNVVSSYAGTPGQVFGTQGIEHSPWLFASGVGYVHNTVGGTEISVRYDVEGRSDYLNQSASVKAKWAF
jgi:autotransporter family porin